MTGHSDNAPAPPARSADDPPGPSPAPAAGRLALLVGCGVAGMGLASLAIAVGLVYLYVLASARDELAPPTAGPAAPPHWPATRPPLAPGVVPLGEFASPLRQVIASGGADGYVAVIGHSRRGLASAAEVMKAATGESVGRFELPFGQFGSGAAVSPDGKWLAVIDGPPARAAVAVYATADGRKAGELTPYPEARRPAGGAKFVAAVPLADDRLLTVNSEGGFDVWGLPTLARVATRPGLSSPPKWLGEVRGHDGRGLSYAVAPDGRVALLDGGAFAVYDPAGPRVVARTEPFFDPLAVVAVPTGTAFDAGGDTLACVYTVHGKGAARTSLLTWDARTGRKRAEAALAAARDGFGLSFWGRDHVLVWGGETKADVLAVADGSAVATLSVKGRGQFARADGDRLWAATDDGDRPLGTYHLVRCDPPAAIPPGTKFVVGLSGLTTE
jgi:hypothetical protein